MKKFFAILLALVMTLSLGAAAFAAEAPTGIIHIENPVTGREYYVYQIFKAETVPGSDPATYSYTIKADSPWYNAVKAYAEDTTTEHGLTLTATAADPNTYVVTIDDSVFSAATFAQYLKGIAPKPTPDATLNEGNNYQDDLPYGYYFVDTNTGTVCSLDTNCPSVEIHDKNEQPPFNKVIVPNPDVLPEVGNLVDFEITGKVPNTVGYSVYHYNVSDTMENLKMKQDSLVVKVGGTTIAATTENAAWLHIETAETSFKVEIDMVQAKEAMPEVFVDDAPIVITYSAYITDAALDTNTAKNTAELNYSNNPANGEETAPINPEPVVLHVFDVRITKVVAGTTTPLPGAEFVLYKEVEGVKYYYKDNPADAEHPQHWVSWVTNIEEATHEVSDESGHVSFVGIEAGTYYLLETAAPEGYNMLTDPVTVEITGDDVSKDFTMDVENSTGSELPSTGGIGTTIFYVIGGLLMVGAAVLLIVRKKMSVED